MNANTDDFDSGFDQELDFFYQLELMTNYEHLDLFENILSSICESTSYNDSPDTITKILITGYSSTELKTSEVKEKIDSTLKHLNYETDIYKLRVMQKRNQDWVAVNQQSFAPILAGSFFIYDESIIPEEMIEELSAGYIPIKINYSQAFGTGQHGTTYNCIRALHQLLERDVVCSTNMLDIGCGSAILSIVAAKLHQTSKIIALDIHEESVKIAKENVIKNGVEQEISVHHADIFKTNILDGHAPFKLVTANIFANPLIEMAPVINKLIANHSIVILSGFYEDDKMRVIEAYQKLGIIAVFEIQKDNWVTVILEKAEVSDLALSEVEAAQAKARLSYVTKNRY